MDRRDYYFGRLHILKRDYLDSPQYGTLLWGKRSKTLDVWVGKTLWTFRLGGRG